MFLFIVKKPIYFIGMLCLLLCGLSSIFFYSPLLDVQKIQYILISSLCILCGKESVYKLLAIFLALCLFLVCELFYHPMVLLIAQSLLIFFVFWQNKSNSEALTFLILAISFIFHLYYVQFSDVDHRQHDLNGVIYYIHQITKNGINWHNFNPWNMYYFFHQPLHFITAGYFYFLELNLWSSTTVAQEGLQYLSLFYVTATTLIASAILRLIKLPCSVYYPALMLFAFNPTLFLFSGYIADDTPVLFWSVLFIYFVLYWILSDYSKYLVYAAFCLGIGTLTKLSILTLTPAVCILFFYKLYLSTQKKKTLTALSFFVIIAVPLSLLWIIRNHILFDMPFYNIPDTSPGGQNFRNLTFGERITDFSSLFSPFINSPYIVEANIWLALIKTELFGEWNLSLNHSIIRGPAFILYFLNVFFKFCATLWGAILIFSSFRARINFSQAIINSFAVCYFIIWGYAFKYAINYPFACSTDYRLFIALMVPEIILLATLAYQTSTAKIFTFISIIYSILTCFIYTTIV